MLKEIGTKARKDLERFFGVKVRLDITVRVREDWSSKDEYLRIQGL
jgi:GTP-binding protein Era